ncbi:hypothetical protein HK104_005094 [Borealophlyctis nickersoniae]|nr:hypothetical protein HK104_005094 [Borealophlyctis nickersoniae]
MTRPGSWRVLRSLKSYEPKPKPKKPRNRDKNKKKKIEGERGGSPTKQVTNRKEDKPGSKEEKPGAKEEKSSADPTAPVDAPNGQNSAKKKTRKKNKTNGKPNGPSEDAGKSERRNGVAGSQAAAAGRTSGSSAFGGTPPFGAPAFGAPAFRAPASGAPAFGGPAIGAPASGSATDGSPAHGGSSVSSVKTSASGEMDELAKLLSARDRQYAWEEDAEADAPKITEDEKVEKKTTPNVREPSPESVLEHQFEKMSINNVEDTKSCSPPFPEATEAPATPDLPPAPPNVSWATLPTFPAYPLEFAPEPDPTDTFDHELHLLAKYKLTERDFDMVDDGGAGGGEGDGASWVGEAYEKVRPKYYNKAFKRFQRVVECEPEQCVRYAFNGTPLFYNTDHHASELTKNGPPPCPRCNSPRVFEFQLMPNVLSILPTESLVPRRSDEQGTKKKKGKNSAGAMDLSAFLEKFAAGMDWGTVLVYSCKEDCEGEGDVSFLEEHIVVQVESLV